VRTYCFPIVLGLSLIAAMMVSAPHAAAQLAEPIIIDHTCTDLEAIPEAWIEEAKSQIRASYGHTSHGTQPIDGMQLLMDDPANNGLYDFTTNGSVVTGMLSIMDRTPAFDIGWGDGNFHLRTRDYLDTDGHDRNLVIWSWCGQVSDLEQAHIAEYLNRMEQLEADYPGVTFVYMTGHLDGTGTEGNLHQRNEQIRAYCLANNKVLYDFADIESYDPDGEAYLHLYADDGCNYNGGNWANEWCAENPGSPLCEECEICAHSESLNCNIKARAFWWMMARLAGWQPYAADTLDCDMACQPSSGVLPLPVRFTATLTNTYTGFARRMASQIDITLPDGTGISRWRAGAANLDPGTSSVSVWINTLPATGMMLGESSFTLIGRDVTPAPFNQPPYPPSGMTDSASCTVTGIAP